MEERRWRRVREECGRLFLLGGSHAALSMMFLGQENTHIHTSAHTQIMQFSAAHACRRFLPSSAAPANKNSKILIQHQFQRLQSTDGRRNRVKGAGRRLSLDKRFKCKLTYSTVAMKACFCHRIQIKKSLTIQRHKCQNSEFLNLKIELFSPSFTYSLLIFLRSFFFLLSEFKVQGLFIRHILNYAGYNQK